MKSINLKSVLLVVFVLGLVSTSFVNQTEAPDPVERCINEDCIFFNFTTNGECVRYCNTCFGPSNQQQSAAELAVCTCRFVDGLVPGGIAGLGFKNFGECVSCFKRNGFSCFGGPGE